MKKLVLLALAFLTLSASALAQELVGTWQGTLTAPDRQRRLLFKFEKGADGVLSGHVWSIDQQAGPFTTTPLRVSGKEVSFEIPGGAIKFVGKFTDETTLTGTWTQGETSDLILKHVPADQAWSIPAPPAQLPPMDPKADPSFDVATVKPSKPDEQNTMINVRGNRVIIVNMPLAHIISFAYELHKKQLVGAPEWVETEKWDITATPDTPGAPSDKQIKSMVRKLIEDRFQFKYHRDKKELSVYVLTVAKGGPKMTANGDNPDGLPGLNFRGYGRMNAQNTNMADFTHMMQGGVLDRPVVDQTGLKGRFDFTLNWTPDDSQFGGRVPPAPAEGETFPSLFTAIQEQIGLKLDPVKLPVEVLVADKMEKPSEN